jgi:ribonuclease Z
MVFFQRCVFLGTSAAVPQPGKRNVSSMFLQFTSGRFVLIDCGEGTQHQLMLSNARMNRVTSVLLTHLHGDHCFGIFGLVHSLAMGGRTEDLHIFGPRGIKELLDTVLRLTGGWNAYKLSVTELDASKTTEFSVPVGETGSVTVTACPMDHRIDALGYVITESARPMKLDMAKVKSLGISGKLIGELKSGKNITLPSGEIVESANYLTPPDLSPRTCAVLQDTADGSSALPYISRCDLLIHECTYDNSHAEKAVEFGHSTPHIAASLARKCNAKRLALTHFSPRYEDTEILAQEARSELSGSGCEVILAADFLEIKF